jgi:hypothetical protein
LEDDDSTRRENDEKRNEEGTNRHLKPRRKNSGSGTKMLEPTRYRYFWAGAKFATMILARSMNDSVGALPETCSKILGLKL